MEPRSSQYVLSKLASLLSSGEDESVLRQYWMPDDITVECYNCTSKFTSFRRRHHCRVCGQVFCSKCCCSYIPGKQIGYSGNLRVCSFCYGFFLNYLDQGIPGSNESGLSISYHNGRRQSMEDSQLSHSPNFGKPGRKTSASTDLYGTTGSGELHTLHEVKESSHDRVILKDTAALACLWERILDPEVGIHLENHRYYFKTYQDTFQGYKLVHWLTSQDDQLSREQAVAIGQALLTAGFFGSVSSQQGFVDGTDIYQPCDRPLVGRDVPDTDVSLQEQDLREPLWLRELADSPYHIEKKTSGSGKTDLRQRNGELSSRQSNTAAKEVQVDRVNGANNVYNLRKELFTGGGSTVVDTHQLDEYYRNHEEEYLTKLAKGRELSDEWRNILKCLADEAVRTVVPDIKYNMDEMDIRCYVKVKSVAGGEKLHSRLVHGEVCSRKLAHKGMATQITKPRIALVANSIMFQREENRMISLESLTMQEEEYIKNVTQKLLQSKPNLVLVEKTVSRLAQDIFLREGVSLALNVKYRVLERLERLTGAKIITSIDSMLAAPVLGTCQSFYVETSLTSQGRNNLLVFDGCSPTLGGTIILQGEEQQTLVWLKAIFKRLLLLKYNWKFEKGFILNEYGWIKQQYEEDSQLEMCVSPLIKVKEKELSTDIVEGADAIEVLGHLESPETVTEKTAEPTRPSGMHPWCSSFVNQRMCQPVSDGQLLDKLSLFRAAGWRNRIEKSIIKTEEHKIFVSLPPDHCETLSVLFSSYSDKSHVAPNFCVAPWVVEMGLYGNYDISLGGFLENFCFSTDYLCPNKQCTTPILQHTRRFCHAEGSISVQMEKFEMPIVGEETDRLMMWKYCPECELITPIVPVTPETWSLSFAMFLHLLFHETQITQRGSDRPDAKCNHSIHQDQHTCFGKMDTVAIFKYNKLQIWKLVPPCPQPELPEITIKHDSLLKKLTSLKNHANSIYSSVQEKLHEHKGENEVLPETIMAQQEAEFQEYRSRVEKLEEEIVTGKDYGQNMIQVLNILTRDVILAQQQWNKKLLSLYGFAQRHYKKSTPSTSTEPDNIQTGQVHNKKSDSDTMKKLISTILPPEREDMVANPFPADTHLIISCLSSHQEPLGPSLVLETEPSSIIHYLLQSDEYKSFIEGTAESNPHLELQFSSDGAQFYSCSYFTRGFHNLRKDIFLDGEDKFKASLSTCRRWEAMGGKSGLLFFKTRDERFILKQMSRFEFQSFTEFAPNYFKYLKQCRDSGTKTLLGKIVGVYKVGYKSETTKTGMKMDLLIMENLFYNKNVDRSYDLKGSVRNRLTVVEGESHQGQVLLDENLVRASCESPLYINASCKSILVEAIHRDTAFLAIHHMMDYSLLAGICRTSGELVVGIIDYIRTFTWDKKLETLVKSVKSSGVFGGPVKTPTVTHPEFYRKRFSDAMDGYFLLVPD